MSTESVLSLSISVSLVRDKNSDKIVSSDLSSVRIFSSLPSAIRMEEKKDDYKLVSSKSQLTVLQQNNKRT